MTREPATIFYDQGCRLCLGTVSFIRRRDRRGRFRFVPLNSPEGAEFVRASDLSCETLHLVDASGHADRSTAVLRIAAGLGWPWSMLRIFWIVPRGLRDAVYKVIARHRLSWFGRTDQTACRRD